LQDRQGLQTGSPDEIAFDAGWIDEAGLSTQADRFGKNDYGRYLRQLLKD
jgi:glucose-1-phosphate thymidylyltransferase